MELTYSDSLGRRSTELYNFGDLEGARSCYNLWEAAKPWIYGSWQNLLSWQTSKKVTGHGYPYVKYMKHLEKSSEIIWVYFLVKFFSLNCTTLVQLGGFDPIGVKLWFTAAAVVVNLVLMELHYLRSHPLLLNEGGGVFSTSRLVSRTWCSLGYTGFRKKSLVQCFCLCSFTVYGLGCSAPALPWNIPFVSPACHKVSILSEILHVPHRAQIVMWKRQPTLENTLSHF